MQINEFIKEVNKVAFARYNKEIDELSVYTNTEYVHHRDWFLLIKPHRTKGIIDLHSWDCLFYMDPKKLRRVLNLVQELEDTPVDDRFPESKYYLPTRFGKFVEGVKPDDSLIAGDGTASILLSSKKCKWSQEQLEALSEISGIPMDVINYWKKGEYGNAD